MKRRKPNYRFLIPFALSLCVVGVGAYFVHGYQIQRNAGALLQLAENAEKNGRMSSAATFLSQYVGLAPKDVDGLARYGKLLANPKMIKMPRDAARAKVVLERALYFDPERADVRREAVRIALVLREYANAREDIKLLLKKTPNDGELKGMLGRCHEMGGKYADARQAYEEAIKLAPHVIDNYVQYVAMLRLHGKEVQQTNELASDVEKRADEVINMMVTANPNEHQAYLFRAEYLQQFSPAKSASASAQIAADIAKAQELNPDGAEVLMAAAGLARRSGNLEEARRLLARGCQLHATDHRMYASAATLEKPVAAIAVLKQGLAKLPNNFDLVWQLADVSTQEGLSAEAIDALAKLKKLGMPEANCNVLQARLLAKNRKWAEAAGMLERAIGKLIGQKGTVNDPQANQLALQAGLALGKCFEQMGDADRAYLTYNRVVAQNPQSVPGLFGLASSLNVMGRPSEALDQYRRLLSVPGRPGSALIEIAKIVFQRNMALDKGRRNWTEVEIAVRDAEEFLTLPLPSAVVILRAETLAAQGQLDAARSHVVNKFPEAKDRPADAWVTLAMLDARQGQLDSALALIGDAGQYHKDSVEIRLANVRLLIRKAPKDAATILAQFESGQDALDIDARRQLLTGLAEIAVLAGEFPSANRLWGRLATEYPDDLRYQLVLFDLAAKNNDDAVLQRSIDQMKKIEGDGGVMWRFATAARLIEKATRGDKSGLREARTLLADVSKRRPNWSRTALCLAQLEDLEGNSDDALAGYQRLIGGGEREPWVMRRTVELLYQKRRFAEAFEIFRQLPNLESLNQDFNRLGSMIALSTNNSDTALRMAESAVAGGSKDYRDYLWLGRVYFAAGQKDKARPAFEQARKFAPSEPETWVTLIQFLAATGAKEQAQTELEEAKKQLKGPAAFIALAHSHESLGQTDMARESYKAAVAASPDDATALRAIAEFYFRIGQLSEAVPHLRRLGIDLRTQHPAPSAWARQSLALTLALLRDPHKTLDAMQLLEAEEKAAPRGADLSNVERTRATILALQGTKRAREEAVQILERLIERRGAILQDYYLAAQLYESLDKWPQARRRYVHLLDQPGGNTPAHRVAFCRSLLRNDGADEAKPIIDQLVAWDSKAWPVQELNARFLHATNKTAEAVKQLQSVADDETRLPLVAGLLSEFGANDAAESLLRRFADKPNRPMNQLALAQFLAGPHRKKYAEAIDLCDRIWTEVPVVAVAETATAVLAELPSNSREFERVERRLTESLQKMPDNSELIVALANLRNFQGRYDDAEKLYRSALVKNPRQGTALNNLAWIIALRGGNVSDALELIKRAMDIMGPDPGLLDTRGVAYLAIKQSQSTAQALKDFQVVIEESPSASAYFHIAQAYVAAGRRDEAKSAWQKAKELRLAPGALHPLERPAYEQLARELN